MILYHFTSPVHLPHILKEGITKGVIPCGGIINPTFRAGYQWLTINPDFNQSWNECSSLPYDRNAYRLAIKIPDMYRAKVLIWLKVCDRLTDIADDLNCYGDPGNWRLFRGVIRPSWIKGVTSKAGILIENFKNGASCSCYPNHCTDTSHGECWCGPARERNLIIHNQPL